MSSSLIRKFPDPILRHPSKSIKKFDSSLKRLVDRLIKIMKSQPGGIGIAAPQIGVLRKVAIVDVSPKTPNSHLLILINPEIIQVDEEIILREGCMSLSDYTANVKRFHPDSIKYRALSGKMQTYTASGLESRCIQHEIDHLNGILFVDRVTSIKSDVFRRKRYKS